MSQFVNNGGEIDCTILALAFAASGDALAIVDTGGALIGVNAVGAAMLGIEAAREQVQENWLDLWPGEDRDAALAALASACAGTRATMVGRCHDTSGAQRWWESTLVPVRDGSSPVDRILVVSRDVTNQRDAAEALDRSARLQQALIQATSEIVWHLDLATGTTLRRGHGDFTGRQDDPGDMDGWLVDVHPDDHSSSKLAADTAEASRKPLVMEYRLRHRSGAWRWVEDRAIPLLDGDGQPTDWVGIITDIDDRKQAERALQKNAEHLRLAVEVTGLATWDIDLTTGEREWSPEFFELLQIPRDTRPDRELFLDRVHPDDGMRVDRELDGAGVCGGHIQHSVFRLNLPYTPERWVEAHERTFADPDGRPIRRVGTIQDVTARKRVEHELWLAAHADALTGVANRTLFQNRLEQAVEAAETESHAVAVLIVDLDRFKELNDSLGHDAGDLLLRTVALRIQALAPEGATVARLGGDEFGLIVPQPESVEAIGKLADELAVALGQPLAYGGRDIDRSASIGWSVYPDHDLMSGSLLKNADMALYAAKSAGRGQAVRFTTSLREEVERRTNVLRCARDALHRDAIVPFYQPKIDLVTGEVMGFEALLRWTDESGLRMPGAIQEAFDDPELSVELGRRMLRCTVADMGVWTQSGIPFGHVAVNLGAPELHDARFADFVFANLAEAHLKPTCLELEVTERVFLDAGAEAIGATLSKLDAAGISISLDDFGTGYASLTHLKRFPVSWLKIDRSFISDLERNAESAAIVRAVVGLAHAIGIKVVAEGVETQEQLMHLKGLGCDVGQGYWFGRPMAGSRVPGFIAAARSKVTPRPRLALT